jgi:hypothetical protein
MVKGLVSYPMYQSAQSRSSFNCVAINKVLEQKIFFLNKAYLPVSLPDTHVLLQQFRLSGAWCMVQIKNLTDTVLS